MISNMDGSHILATMNHIFHLPEALDLFISPTDHTKVSQQSQEHTGFVPAAVDIKQTPKEYVFYVDVPGLSKSDIQKTAFAMGFGKSLWIYFAVALIACHSYVSAAPAAARIASIPGYNGSLPSEHYGGYISIDTKNLYYYFVTSEGNPQKDPLVLWLNGGPGCSSFDGFIYEHGPFNFELPEKTGSLPKLHPNPYSWSKVANVIYLDSPCGVGLSYSPNNSDYATGDNQTALDSHIFLMKWFGEYPEFLANPFFITGESYAGVYVPTLTWEVLKGIEAGIKPTINLKGYMVGNGVTDTVYDGNALVPFVHGMGLISDDLYEGVKNACQGNYWNPTDTECSDKLSKMDEDISPINIYDILEPCYHSPEIQEVVASHANLPETYKDLGKTERPLKVRRRMFGRAWPLRAPVKDGYVPNWPQLNEEVPCTDDRVASVWLNDDSVRSSIHAETKTIAGAWQICTDCINFQHDLGSMISYHKNLTSKGIRAFIYSGDHDMGVPFTGSEAWTRSLGYPIIDEWRPWFVDGQVAGFTQGYSQNLTFATIKGAGHTVPEYKPKEALTFFSKFLKGLPL